MEAHAAPAGRVRILSYNIFERPACVESSRGDEKEIRLRLFAQRLDDYDVVCLQEMFWSWSARLDALLEEARARGFGHAVVSPRPFAFPPFFCDGGVVILSRFPVLRESYALYPRGTLTGGDYFAAKGALWALLQMPDGSRLHSAYLSATQREPAPVFWQIQQRQLRALRAFVDRCMESSPGPAVLCGDFNIDARPPLLRPGEPAPRPPPETPNYRWAVEALGGVGRVRDLLKESCDGVHPPTYGDRFAAPLGPAPPLPPGPWPPDPLTADVVGYRRAIPPGYAMLPREVRLTNVAGSAPLQRIDYVLFLEGRGEAGRAPASGGGARPAGRRPARVEPLFVRRGELEGEAGAGAAAAGLTQLSDHCGVAADLQLQPAIAPRPLGRRRARFDS
eukprot:tig00021462_g21600.t1